MCYNKYVIKREKPLDNKKIMGILISNLKEYETNPKVNVIIDKNELITELLTKSTKSNECNNIIYIMTNKTKLNNYRAFMVGEFRLIKFSIWPIINVIDLILTHFVGIFM